jgi:hypothetical protein
MVYSVALADSILKASDPIDIRAWSIMLADDVHLRVGSRPVAVGRKQALGELRLLFAKADALGRGFCAVWPGNDRETVLLELELTPSAGGVAIPVAIIARAIDPNPLLRDLRFYLDLRFGEGKKAC